ncbi:hypothetical protein RSOLAG1IB_12185 [Rhizoctonia solani AG-1 IB]|uniref:Uncharacterized protein n=1 Tax=Thanatephorus cucumeris (strain AG1-IB / isolate 7/3/14) TaxID=1108050 RepID=A0A0B7FM11_THACB|nr:hypothetical protein RSOLAG1IB_12185 [Rhizoctonia solani AG-1 IB]
MLLFAARNANEKPRAVQKDMAEKRKGMAREKMQVDTDEEQDKESVVDEDPEMDVDLAAGLDSDSGPGCGSESSENEADAEDSGEEDSPPRKRKIPTTVPQFKSERDLEDYISRIRADFDQHAKFNRRTRPTRSIPSRSSLRTAAKITKATSAVKIEHEGDVEMEEKALDDTAKDNLIKAITSRGFLSITGMKRLNNAANAQPIEAQDGSPVWYNKDDLLVPHYHRTFAENWSGWKGEFYAAVKSVMDPSEKEILKNVPMEAYRNALITGAFQTAKQAYMDNLDGKGDTKKGKKNESSRKGGRRSAKAKARTDIIEASELPVEEFGFLGDFGYASPAFSDRDSNGKSNRLVVYEPLFRTKEVTEILLAIDRAHVSQRARTGNSPFSRIEYAQVHTETPKMKKYKIPMWSIPDDYETKYPEQFKQLRTRIDFNKTVMPYPENVNSFLRAYEADGRTYIQLDSSTQASAGPLILSSSTSTFVESRVPNSSHSPSIPEPIVPAPNIPAPNTVSAQAHVTSAHPRTSTSMPVQSPMLSAPALVESQTPTSHMAYMPAPNHTTAPFSQTLPSSYSQPLGYIAQSGASYPQPSIGCGDDVSNGSLGMGQPEAPSWHSYVRQRKHTTELVNINWFYWSKPIILPRINTQECSPRYD